MLVDEESNNNSDVTSNSFLANCHESINKLHVFPHLIEKFNLFYKNILANKITINEKIDSDKFKQLFIILVFFPPLDYLENSLSFTKNCIELSFRDLINKAESNSSSSLGIGPSKIFFDIFSKNSFEEILSFSSDNLYLKDVQREDDESIYFIRDLCILHFISEYKMAFNTIKEKYLSLGEGLNNKTKNNYDEILKTICFFQESFKGYFFFVELLGFLKSEKVRSIQWKKKETEIMLENILLTQVSEMGKYFINISSEFNEILSREDYSSRFINHSNWTSFSEEVLTCLKFSNKVASIKKWNKLFSTNQILTSIITIKFILSNNLQDKNILELLKQFNYGDIFEAFTKFKSIPNMSRIFVKCVSVYYLMFNSDMNSFGFLISPEYKVFENVIKYNSDIINLLWNVKCETESEYYMIKDDVEKLMNDIISNKEETMIYLFNSNFIEGMIKFILENIESSHISSKFIDDLIHSKIPEKIINGFLLLGYWANTYPIKYIHVRMLDILFIMKKNVDLRTVLTTEENISKFMKGLYLIFKAFPKLNEDQVSFINYLKDNINYWISDYNLNNFARKMLDRTNYFVEKILIGSDYQNENTLFVRINK